MTESFEDLVEKDVRHGCSPPELQVLESNIREWIKKLNSLKRDVEVQLSAQKARNTQKQAEMLRDSESTKADWLDYKSKEDRWKVGAIRFMVSVEDRIAYAKNLRASQNTKVMTA